LRLEIDNILINEPQTDALEVVTAFLTDPIENLSELKHAESY
jgi:hypothetical protein